MSYNSFSRPRFYTNSIENLYTKGSFSNIDPIFLSLLIASNISNESEYEFLRNLLLCTSPVFLVGFIDDMKISIPPFVRLMLIIPSSLLCYYFLGTKAENLEIPFIDLLFQYEIFEI